ncbi:hypothetical protein M514_01797 [Trichuris suis]|uniref:U5 small nuclear ribonucleoprotein 40 kDa protein n=1 Tax=Trichuris suis TaxID=68888 RepID=A0A085MJ90_9BILA|nr:hypothetical protein M513_01797 [Trichuris suis]KFD72673.1 hypothetical protein M514_01797 [Trichuris suis]
MTRHQKNATASTVYTYYERKKDQKASGYGTLEERLSKNAFKDFDCCSLTLQRCRDPVVTPEGYLFDYEAILKYILHHKKENVRKRKLYEDYLAQKERELEDEKEAQMERKVRRFETAEATPARRNISSEESDQPTTSGSSLVSKPNGNSITEVKNFWVPSLSGSVVDKAVPKPPANKVLCPVTGKPLKLKDLLHVKFKVASSVSESELASGKNVYVCALTGDLLTNATPCVVLKTSGYVITVESLEKVVKKEWIDPFNGKKLTEGDLIFLQRGGTGFAATNENLQSKQSAMDSEPLAGPMLPAAYEANMQLRIRHKAQSRRFSHLSAPIILLQGHMGEVYTAKFSKDGTFLASAGFDQKILLWNVYGECDNFAVLSGHTGAIMELHFSAESDMLVTCSTDKTIRIWDMETGVCLRKFKGHTSFVNSCHLARRGPRLICSGSDDGTIKVWDQRKRDYIHSFDNKYQVTAVTFNDTTEHVIAGGIDNDLKVWDLRKGVVAYGMFGHVDTVTGLCLSPDGSHVLSNSMDCTVRIWDIRPFAPEVRCVRVLQGNQHNFEKNLLRCSWSPDGNKVSAGSSDRYVYVWDVMSQRILYKLPGHFGSVNETDFHPCEPIILSAGSDKKVYMGELEM